MKDNLIQSLAQNEIKDNNKEDNRPIIRLGLKK